MKNIIIWFKVIWNLKYWDYSCVYEVLYKLFEQMEKHHRLYGNAVTSQKRAKELMIVKNLCKRLLYEIHFENATKSFYEKYGHQDLKKCFHKTEGGCWTFKNDRPIEVQKIYNRLIDHGENMESRDLHELFTRIERQIRRWWN